MIVARVFLWVLSALFFFAGLFMVLQGPLLVKVLGVLACFMGSLFFGVSFSSMLKGTPDEAIKLINARKGNEVVD